MNYASVEVYKKMKALLVGINYSNKRRARAIDSVAYQVQLPNGLIQESVSFTVQNIN